MKGENVEIQVFFSFLNSGGFSMNEIFIGQLLQDTQI